MLRKRAQLFCGQTGQYSVTHRLFCHSCTGRVGCLGSPLQLSRFVVQPTEPRLTHRSLLTQLSAPKSPSARTTETTNPSKHNHTHHEPLKFCQIMVFPSRKDLHFDFHTFSSSRWGQTAAASSLLLTFATVEVAPSSPTPSPPSLPTADLSSGHD